MPQRQATYITYGKDDGCDEIRKFIEDAGIALKVRDLMESPPSVQELTQLFGHNPLTYFVNPASEAYSRLGLDKALPERGELLALISANPQLLRCPIIKNTRLLTVGCNKEKIAEMLQIGRNGEAPEETTNHRSSGRITRRALPSRK